MTRAVTDEDSDSGGFDIDDWMRLKPFSGRVASLQDVQDKLAVFALEDTERPWPLDMELPQPVIWWEDDGEQAAIAIQAECHTSPEGEELEVLGLILPDGSAVVALLEDVDLVADTDPTWQALVASACDGIDPDEA